MLFHKLKIAFLMITESGNKGDNISCNDRKVFDVGFLYMLSETGWWGMRGKCLQFVSLFIKI